MQEPIIVPGPDVPGQAVYDEVVGSLQAGANLAAERRFPVLG